MAKRKTNDLSKIDERMRILILRLRRDGAELAELHDRRRRVVNGKLKLVAPPGVKRDLPRPDFNDEIPL